MRLSWLLARRFRSSPPGTGHIRAVSHSSVIGIALGCAIIITLLSVMNGFYKALEEELLSVVPQVEFEAVQGTLYDWQQVAQTAQNHQEVIATAPAMTFTAMIQQKKRFYGLQTRAIDTELEQGVSGYRRYIQPSDWEYFEAHDDAVLLGSGAAQALQLQIGDPILLIIPAFHQEGLSQSSPKYIWFTFAGTFHFGGELDYRQAYVHLPYVQERLGLKNVVNTVRVKIKDMYQAPRVAQEVGNQLTEYAYMHDWTYTEGHLYQDIQLVRTVMYLVLFLVLAVASFHVVATLMMQVQDKKSTIAILRTMGAKRSLIVASFMAQGVMSGCIGIVYGVLGGVTLTLSLPYLVQSYETYIGHAILSDSVYFIDSLPVQLLFGDIVFVALCALFLSCIAAIYPAYRAARLEPVVVFRAL